ncbi:MAG: hypothetical protein WC305_01565 [Bacteroidales bacterium]
MNNRFNLKILLLSNYRYILYLSSEGDLFLTLTREQGFGVYSYTIKVDIQNKENKEQTEKEIEEIRSEYIKNPDNFSKKHEEIILESVDTKRALKNGFQKMSKH